MKLATVSGAAAMFAFVVTTSAQTPANLAIGATVKPGDAATFVKNVANNATAICEKGTSVVGGGWVCNPRNPECGSLTINETLIDPKENSYSFKGEYRGAIQSIRVTAYAYCLGVIPSKP